MIRFDEVLPKIIKEIESFPFASNPISATIIRDLQGRVRLVFEFQQASSNWGAEKQSLESKLANTLDQYWGKKIW